MQDEIVDLIASTNAIEKSVVVKGTRTGYTARLVDLLLWLYDNGHRTVIYQNCHDRIQHAEELDNKHDELIRKGQLKTPSGRKSKAKPGQRNRTRECLKSLVRGMDRHDPSKCPIILKELTYAVLTDYMSTKFKVVTVDRKSAVRFLKEVKLLMGGDGGDNVILDKADANANCDGEVMVKIRQEYTTYEGIRSTVAHMYRESGVVMPQDLDAKMAVYVKGSRRINLLAKQMLGLKISEGKEHMTKEVYSKIASILFESGQTEHMFAHLFFVLDWNLMKRAENCNNCRITHIRFEDDCLVFQFAKSKGSQDGEDHLGPWHVYANPLEPHICPVLSLAKYLITYPSVLSGKLPLFEGSDPYNRYTKIFSKVIKDHMDELRHLGVSEGDLGTHSSRKGVATLVAAGCTASPPIVSICLRAGWSMGGVKERYFRHERAGDRYVGRCASCLDQSSKDFAVSCPYFDFTGIKDPVARLERKKYVKKWLINRLPMIEKVESHVFNVLQYCFASICYHYDMLQERMDASSPVSSSIMMREIPKEIWECARVAYPWTKTSDTPTFTGIPPHILILAELEEVKMKFVEVGASMRNGLKDELNERGIGGSEYHTNVILQAISNLETKCMNSTHKHSESRIVDLGVAADSFDLIDEDDKFDEFDTAISESENYDETQARKKRKRDEISSSVKKQRVTVGLVKGKLTSVRRDFTFPAMTTEQLIHHWFLGDISKNTVPFCRLCAHDVAHLKQKNSRKKINKMGRFMEVIERYGRMANCWHERKSDWSPESVSLLWLNIGNKYISRYFANKQAAAWLTVNNAMVKKGCYKKKREDCKSDEEWNFSIHNVSATMQPLIPILTPPRVIKRVKISERARLSATKRSTAHRARVVVEIGSGDGVASDIDYSKGVLTGSTTHKATVVVELGSVDGVVHGGDSTVMDKTKNRNDAIGPELMLDELEIVNSALNSKGSASEKIVRIGLDSVQRSSFQTLCPGRWLNDEVIHAYFVLLQKREYLLARPDTGTGRSHFFKSFFFTKLFDEGGTNEYTYNNVKSWSDRVQGKDIFCLDKMIFACNVNSTHWTCVVIFMNEKRIQYYDSLRGDGYNYSKGLLRYLKDEWKRKKGSGNLPDERCWKIVGNKSEVPSQSNGFDCGVFTCMYADFLSMESPLMFNQQHIRKCRQRIALSLLKGEIV